MPSKFRVATPDAFDLLEAVGRDCAGALQLLPPAVEPVGFNQVQAQPLSERQVAAHLRRTVTSASLGSHQQMDDLRSFLSLERRRNQHCSGSMAAGARLTGPPQPHTS
jgi:serine/threonine-protein kinase HipA